MAHANATFVPTKVARQASSHRSTSSLIIQVIYLVNPPKELRNVIPEYFMLCDFGATHHMLSNSIFMAYSKDKFLQVSWGDASTSRTLSIGYLIITSYYLSSDSARSDRVLLPVAHSTPCSYRIALALFILLLVHRPKGALLRLMRSIQAFFSTGAKDLSRAAWKSTLAI